MATQRNVPLLFFFLLKFHTSENQLCIFRDVNAEFESVFNLILINATFQSFSQSLYVNDLYGTFHI